MAVLDTLGQSVMPNVFASLEPAGIGETLTIKRRAVTNSNGSPLQSVSDAYTGIKIPPVQPVNENGRDKETKGDKVLSRQLYLLTLPTHKGGTRIDFDKDSDYFVIDARGNEPAKTY